MSDFRGTTTTTTTKTLKLLMLLLVLLHLLARPTHAKERQPKFIDPPQFESKCTQWKSFELPDDVTLDELIQQAGASWWETNFPDYPLLSFDEPVDVVIIGGGMSGVTAASTLDKDDRVTFVLLEAKNKLGGVMQKNDGFRRRKERKRSSHMISLEDGPNWIGGDYKNPIFQLAKDFNLRVYPNNFYEIYSFAPDGTAIDSEVVSEAINRYGTQFYGCVDAQANQLRNGTDGDIPTIRDALVNDCGWSARPPTQDLDEFVVWWNTDYADGGSADNSSLITWPIYTFNELFDPSGTNYEGYYLEYHVVDHRGYQRIPIQYAKREIKNQKRIHLNEEVCKVFHTDEGALVITSKNKAYRTKKVITTINPSIYISSTVQPFEPLLMTEDDFPFQKGQYQMVYYQFPKSFWPDQEFINVVYPKDQVGQCGWFQNLHKRLDEQQYQTFYPNLAKQAPHVDRFNWKGKRGKILKCLIATDAIARLPKGKVTRDLVQNDFLEPLRNHFKENYTEPRRIYLPNFDKDPFTQDLLVGIKKGVGPEGRVEFLQKGSKSIHISGTQKCDKYAGWVHGAYHAGILSATEVLEELVGGVEPYLECNPDATESGARKRKHDPRADFYEK